jgi:uncharacterized protein
VPAGEHLRRGSCYPLSSPPVWQAHSPKKGIKRADKDFAIAWVKEHGKGRVFCSTLGHTEESWADKNIQGMWLEAVKWTLKLTDATAEPRQRPAN